MTSAYWDITGGSDPGAPGSGIGRIYADANGNLYQHINGQTNGQKLLGGTGVFSTTTPSDPTGTASTTLVMAGLAIAFTPSRNGNILLMATAYGTNSTAAAGDGARMQLSYGTTTAPTNGAALTGTQTGNISQGVLMRATANDPFTLACHAAVALTVGTAYWLDLAFSATAGGTGLIKSIAISAIEI